MADHNSQAKDACLAATVSLLISCFDHGTKLMIDSKSGRFYFQVQIKQHGTRESTENNRDWLIGAMQSGLR